jgi:hypothetical protein
MDKILTDEQFRDYLTVLIFQSLRKGCAVGVKYVDVMETSVNVYNRMKKEQDDKSP